MWCCTDIVVLSFIVLSSLVFDKDHAAFTGMMGSIIFYFSGERNLIIEELAVVYISLIENLLLSNIGYDSSVFQKEFIAFHRIRGVKTSHLVHHFEVLSCEWLLIWLIFLDWHFLFA